MELCVDLVKKIYFKLNIGRLEFVKKKFVFGRKVAKIIALFSCDRIFPFNFHRRRIGREFNEESVARHPVYACRAANTCLCRAYGLHMQTQVRIRARHIRTRISSMRARRRPRMHTQCTDIVLPFSVSAAAASCTTCVIGFVWNSSNSRMEENHHSKTETCHDAFRRAYRMMLKYMGEINAGAVHEHRKARFNYTTCTYI